MGDVVQLPVGLEKFFETIYGDQQGWAYAPTKDPVNNSFEQYWFHWPTSKNNLINHVQTMTSTHEVYYGTGLFSKQEATKEGFKGTWFVWAEFDGSLPEPGVYAQVPAPSIKLRSSEEQHEHWYWKLDHFETNIEVIEEISRKLTYHLGADLGSWNANRVLRPPGTIHHESGKITTLLRWDPQTHAVEEFSNLPEITVELAKENDIGYIPKALSVIFKYQFTTDEYDFYSRESIEVGHRSSALTKLGHIGVEKGMTDAEILGFLWNADERWGKFKGRKDRKRLLLGIVNYCRAKSKQPKPVDQEVDHLRVYNFVDFQNTDIEIEWVIPGLIHKKGRVLISGPPGVGKSQVAFRMAQKLAEGKPFLKWEPTRPIRMMFVSMEMPHEELKYITSQMNIQENELLRENLQIMPIGYSIQLTKAIAQAEFANKVEQHQPDGIIFDSLGVGIGGGLQSDQIILDTFYYVKKVLSGQYGVFSVFIHHNRKEQTGNKKPTKLDDLFGSAYIGAELTTGLNLWPTAPMSPLLEFSCLKLRMMRNFSPFMIRRTPELDFEVVEGTKIVAPSIPIFSNLSDTDTEAIKSDGPDLLGSL
jgi:DNA polymerase III delta prime subunit